MERFTKKGRKSGPDSDGNPRGVTNVKGRRHSKNKENQFIAFRLLVTKEEKPRFFLLCQQTEGRKSGPGYVEELNPQRIITASADK
ncbi:hypothetical protein [Dryocola sp. BD613]|uniref:hypothetical protein n=1 Tax=Dryocola sp. BD613 TaxID=3133272 RepID=UPI003F4F49D6